MEFYEVQVSKKTRKEHLCESCERTIPVGSVAYNHKGKAEGEFFSYYMCTYCYENDVCHGDEYVDGDNFRDWLEEQDFSQCPECRHWLNQEEWEWIKDNQEIKFTCNECEHEWQIHVGFDSAKE